MRTFIQILLFAAIYFLLFQGLKLFFDLVNIGTSIQIQSMIQLLLLIVMFFAALIITKMLSKYLK